MLTHRKRPVVQLHAMCGGSQVAAGPPPAAVEVAAPALCLAQSHVGGGGAMFARLAAPLVLSPYDCSPSAMLGTVTHGAALPWHAHVDVLPSPKVSENTLSVEHLQQKPCESGMFSSSSYAHPHVG